MPLPQIQPISHCEIYVSGDVIIHESAVIAPGTILQAAPNSQIIIREGVCLGMGTILTAYQGSIIIEAGAMVGAGVLMVGHARIGQNACIGAATTIWNASIEGRTVVPAGSLIGDTSRKIAIIPEDESIDIAQSLPSSSQVNGKEKGHYQAVEEDLWATETEIETKTEENLPLESNIEVQVQTPSTELEEKTPTPSSPVVGQVYINQLLVTLFPDRNSSNRLK
jgi:carbon dioxide concentrating mechanism protein CcmN